LAMLEEEHIYVIDAEITFEAPVSPDLQEVARFSLGSLQTPTHLQPTVRWVMSRRALVGDLAVSAGTQSVAIETARNALRECILSIPLNVRSVAILSIRLGTL
jgi:hypothetical protein